MMQRTDSRRGTAFLIAMVLTVLFLGFTLSLLGMAVAHSNDAWATAENLRALMAAEAGLHEAIADLNRGGDGTVSGAFGGVTFDARAIQAGDRWLIDSVGTSQGFRRATRTVAVPALPVPVDRAAITIVGPAGDAAALDTVSSSGGNVLVSGMSAGLPAVGVEDPLTYTTILEDLVPKIASGAVSDNTFRGTPEVTYTASDGSSAEVPILEMPTPEWDDEKLEMLRTRLIDKVINGLIPTATMTYGPGSTTFTSPTTLGGVTVIDGASLNADSNVNGSGILIIRGGSLAVSTHSQFHWNGTVFVLGKAGAGAELVNAGGTMTVQGNVIVLGDQGSASNLTIASGQSNSNTLINGAVLLMAGGAANDAARFQVGSGGVNMHGWVGIFGATAQIYATNQQGVFNVLGSMTVGVDGSDPQDGLAEIDFDGNVHVQYNQNHLDRAIAGLLGLISSLQLPPPTYRSQGWVEISPLVAYQPNGAALDYTPSMPAAAPGSGSGLSTSPDTGGKGSLRVGGGPSSGGGKK